MSKLILVRHGESEWNASEKLTGQADVGLTEHGKSQAKGVGDKTRNIRIDCVYISELRRTAETLSAIQTQRDMEKPMHIVINSALNERSFGLLTGKKKADVIAKMGNDAYMKMLKGWNISAPEGESLEMVYERVVPFFKDVILKDLQADKNVLIVSHHQTLRSLVKYFENISHEKIANLKLENAKALIYEFNSNNDTFRKVLLRQ